MPKHDHITGLLVEIGDNVLCEVADEVDRSAGKHGDEAMVSPKLEPSKRLAILGEEFGEVCHEMTYDTTNGEGALRKELIQTAAMAVAWVMALDCAAT